jgi:hypothetical protein
MIAGIGPIDVPRRGRDRRAGTWELDIGLLADVPNRSGDRKLREVGRAEILCWVKRIEPAIVSEHRRRLRDLGLIFSMGLEKVEVTV